METLQTLVINNDNKLTSIPFVSTTLKLYNINHRLDIPQLNLDFLDIYKCDFLYPSDINKVKSKQSFTIQNRWFGKDNINKISKLQKYIKNSKLRRIIRLTHSKEFIEYFYAPNQIGGKRLKKQIEKVFE